MCQRYIVAKTRKFLLFDYTQTVTFFFRFCVAAPTDPPRASCKNAVLCVWGIQVYCIKRKGGLHSPLLLPPRSHAFFSIRRHPSRFHGVRFRLLFVLFGLQHSLPGLLHFKGFHSIPPFSIPWSFLPVLRGPWPALPIRPAYH